MTPSKGEFARNLTSVQDVRREAAARPASVPAAAPDDLAGYYPDGDTDMDHANDAETLRWLLGWEVETARLTVGGGGDGTTVRWEVISTAW